MARLVVEEQKEFPTLPNDSIVHLKVESVEVRTVRGQRGDWDKLEYKFKILGVQSTPGDHPQNYDGLIGENIYGSTSTKITDSQENKLRLWAEAILNRQLELGFELDTDWFVGREVRGVTSQYQTKQGYDRHQVQSLLPMGNGAGVVPGAAPQQAPVQQAPQGWGAPQVQPNDPWATPAPAPAANDPWSAQPQGQPGQQYATPVAQAPAQKYAPAGTQSAFDDEPPF